MCQNAIDAPKFLREHLGRGVTNQLGKVASVEIGHNFIGGVVVVYAVGEPNPLQVNHKATPSWVVAVSLVTLVNSLQN